MITQTEIKRDILYKHSNVKGGSKGSYEDETQILFAMQVYANLSVNPYIDKIIQLENENIALQQAGEKLIGILTNIRHEIDYLPDMYYEWINTVIHEIEELFSKEE